MIDWFLMVCKKLAVAAKGSMAKRAIGERRASGPATDASARAAEAQGGHDAGLSDSRFGTRTSLALYHADGRDGGLRRDFGSAGGEDERFGISPWTDTIARDEKSRKKRSCALPAVHCCVTCL